MSEAYPLPDAALDDGGSYHPFIEGLLKTLPVTGTVWAIEGRAAWLEAAASVFKLLYQGDGRITIAAEVVSYFDDSPPSFNL